MKFFTVLENVDLDTVAPLVGAWIEIRTSDIMLRVYDVAPLVGAWIEIYGGNDELGGNASLLL